jgi:D-glycero-D-manno-heptose 1,7-bisphosphate phosphatase
VVTNQSGVGRGLFTEQTLAAIHERMETAVRETGGELAAVYYCPHRPDEGCDCRKPKTALLRQLERDLGCSLAGAPFIGDRLSDVEAADGVGARAMLVRTGTGAATERLLRERSLEVFDDLAAATRFLLAEVR